MGVSPREQSNKGTLGDKIDRSFQYSLHLLGTDEGTGSQNSRPHGKLIAGTKPGHLGGSLS